jgi:hypothetical protein
LHPHAHGNMRVDRLHVWHMKVLRYTVFNDQKVATPERSRSRLSAGGDEAAFERESSLEDVPSKLSSTAGSRSELKLGSLPERSFPIRGSDVRKRSLNRSRRDPQLDISHNWPANPWMLRHRLWST